MKTKYAILAVMFVILAFAPIIVKADVNSDLSKQFSDLSRQMDDLQRSQQSQGGYYEPLPPASNAHGYLDEARADGIYGWAWDPDAGANPIQIKIYVDGAFGKTVTADQERPDIYVDPSRPVGTKHGYSWKNHGLTGTHTIEAFAVDYPSGTQKSLGVKTYYGSGASNAIPPSSYHPQTTPFTASDFYESNFPLLLIIIIVVVVIVVVIILVYFFVMKGSPGTSTPAAPSSAPAKSPPSAPAKKKMPPAPKRK